MRCDSEKYRTGFGIDILERLQRIKLGIMFTGEYAVSLLKLRKRKPLADSVARRKVAIAIHQWYLSTHLPNAAYLIRIVHIALCG